MGRYTLFKRRYPKNDNLKHHFYRCYCYYEQGKKIQKPAGRKCTFKRFAEGHITDLKEQDKLSAKDFEMRLHIPTIGEIAAAMFEPGQPA